MPNPRGHGFLALLLAVQDPFVRQTEGIFPYSPLLLYGIASPVVSNEVAVALHRDPVRLQPAGFV